MSQKSIFRLLVLLIALSLSACGEEEKPLTAKEIQEKLIQASPGSVLEIKEGTYEFDGTLSIDGIKNITLKGAGMDKTIFSFKGQKEGAEGLMIKADGITLEGFSVMDAKGDAIKIQNSNGVNIRKVRTGWSGAPKKENGAYGLYPVTCKNVVIEDCEAHGASDAGIYVGQSEQVIVRRCKVWENVAGIEIENCTWAEVYECKAENNTGGILVFDLPDLPVKNGQKVKVYKNIITGNNHPNFAPKGNMVAIIPPGTGFFAMAYDDVDVYENEFKDNKTAQASIISFLITKREMKDTLYNPYYSNVRIHNNTFSKTPTMPDTTTDMGKLVAMLFGSEVPDIMVDGLIDPSKLNAEGKFNDPADRVCIGNNGTATFANLSAATEFKEVNGDIAPFTCE